MSLRHNKSANTEPRHRYAALPQALWYGYLPTLCFLSPLSRLQRGV